MPIAEVAATGGSTNSVLHFFFANRPRRARHFAIQSTIFDRISSRTPILA